MLGPQPAGALRHPGPVTARRALLLTVLVAGCATRGDLLDQDRRLRGLIQEQRRQMQALQRELERLRADVESGGPRTPSGTAARDRLRDIEDRLAALERQNPQAAVPPVDDTDAIPADQEIVPPPTTTATTPPAVAATPPSTVPAAPPAEDLWRRDVAREQAEAGTLNVPERGAYLQLLDGLARKDCTRSIPQLNSFAAANRESPLADDALYWAARCYAVTGDQNQAITKFYDIVTRYPKSNKAPAALLAQGNLFLSMGDTPDARLALGKLIRDYPNSEEAAIARQRLTQLDN